MSDAYTVAVNDLRVTACSVGASWGLSCWDVECKARIVGYADRTVAIKAAAVHLIWHINGKPMCRDCGAWLSHRTSKRCRKGTCEVDR